MPAATEHIGIDIGITRTLEPAPRTLTRAEASHNVSRILFWNPNAIPWVARTEAYTQALLSGRVNQKDDPHLAALFRHVEAQVILDRADARKVIFLGATALRQNYSDEPQVQQQQLTHLIDVANGSNGSVEVRVLPETVNASIVADKGAVTLYEHPTEASVIEEETWAEGVMLSDDPVAVREAEMIFAALHQRALGHEESVAYIQSLI